MKIIDLSHTVRSGMEQRFAGPVPYIFEDKIRKTEHFEAIDDHCILQNHVGTHIDAPKHYNPNHGIAVHQLPLEQLITPAVILDLRHKERSSMISAEDLQAAVTAGKEEIRPNDAVILHTGMSQFFHTWSFSKGGYRNSEYGAYPSLEEGACHWLVEKKISLIGVDTVAPDLSPDYRPAHQILLRDNNIPIVENLCNLYMVKRTRVLFIAMPPKVEGVSGFLVRAVAIEDLGQNTFGL